MAIIKKPNTTQQEDQFIGGAPDSGEKKPAIKGVRKGNKQQISLTIKPELLEKIDQLSDDLGLSRASLINLAIHRAIEHGLIIDGLK